MTPSEPGLEILLPLKPTLKRSKRAAIEQNELTTSHRRRRLQGYLERSRRMLSLSPKHNKFAQRSDVVGTGRNSEIWPTRWRDNLRHIPNDTAPSQCPIWKRADLWAYANVRR